MTTASSALWGNIVSAAGVFVVTAGLIGTWVNQRVSPIEARIDADDRRLDRNDQTIVALQTLVAQHTTDLGIMQKDVESKLNMELFRTSREGLIKQIEDDKSNIIRVMEELSHQIHALEEKIVYRDENKQHWDIEQANKEELLKRIADLAVELDKRITDLTARVNTLTAAPTPASPNAPR